VPYTKWRCSGRPPISVCLRGLTPVYISYIVVHICDPLINSVLCILFHVENRTTATVDHHWSCREERSDSYTSRSRQTFHQNNNDCFSTAVLLPYYYSQVYAVIAVF